MIPRLLVLKMQADFGAGYGYWKQTQGHLLTWPAQELVRVGWRKTHRQWSGLDRGNIIPGEPEEGRWAEAGGQLYDGRMIALVNDPIWNAISRFGITEVVVTKISQRLDARSVTSSASRILLSSVLRTFFAISSGFLFWKE